MNRTVYVYQGPRYVLLTNNRNSFYGICHLEKFLESGAEWAWHSRLERPDDHKHLLFIVPPNTSYKEVCSLYPEYFI